MTQIIFDVERGSVAPGAVELRRGEALRLSLAGPRAAARYAVTLSVRGVEILSREVLSQDSLTAAELSGVAVDAWGELELWERRADAASADSLARARLVVRPAASPASAWVDAPPEPEPAGLRVEYLDLSGVIGDVALTIEEAAARAAALDRVLAVRGSALLDRPVVIGAPAAIHLGVGSSLELSPAFSWAGGVGRSDGAAHYGGVFEFRASSVGASLVCDGFLDMGAGEFDDKDGAAVLSAPVLAVGAGVVIGAGVQSGADPAAGVLLGGSPVLRRARRSSGAVVGLICCQTGSVGAPWPNTVAISPSVPAGVTFEGLA